MPQPEKYTKAWMSQIYKISDSTRQNWLKREPLRSKLLQTGYNKFQKKFTPQQWKIIVEHLDLP
jgi:hypothetical protein